MKLNLTKKPHWIMKFRFEGCRDFFTEKVDSLALAITHPIIEAQRKKSNLGSARVHVGYSRNTPYTKEEQEEAKDWLHSRRHTPMKLKLKSSAPMKIPKPVKNEPEEFFDENEVEFTC